MCFRTSGTQRNGMGKGDSNHFVRVTISASRISWQSFQQNFICKSSCPSSPLGNINFVLKGSLPQLCFFRVFGLGVNDKKKPVEYTALLRGSILGLCLKPS